MIYLDTHAVVWLYQKDRDRFTTAGLELIDSEELFISPMVELELEFLYEIDRINVRAKVILDFLRSKIELNKCAYSFSEITEKASSMKWTRDPFDRIITAHAAVRDSVLLSKDRQIRKNYPKTVW